ncbi:sensor histidine kinase [Prosthecobacter sp.]|uniref:sensor histidine kinase n=1 Tax=Prosthecobacter sp. TaxID=1965333 RepID=UPI0037850728
MKWLPNSIRWRIQLWHGLLLLAVLTGFGITAYFFQYENVQARVDGELRLRLYMLHDQLTRGHPGEGAGPPPADENSSLASELFGLPMLDRAQPPRSGGMLQRPEVQEAFQPHAGYYFHLWFRDGGFFDKSPNAPAGLAMPTRAASAVFRDRPGVREAYDFTPPGECLLVGVDDSGFRAEMRRFTGEIIGYGSIVLLLGLLGGWWVASRAIAPIRDISEAAQRIAGGQLQERIPVAETESELGQLTAVLNDTFTRLAAAFDEQARFTSDAAHELRTPVSVILAQTQLALARPRTIEAHLKTIEMTRRSALRMQELIESLLTLAQADAKTATPSQACQLDEISRENMEHIRPLAEERGIILHQDLAPATCAAPPDHITQIVTNLLANAVKYCRPGDAVRLSTQRENGHACLTVADTGPGISAEHLPHLFERFYRAEASRNRAAGGAGLGLAICKALAEAHGGSITVQSELAKGTVFQLRLPAV